MTGSLIGAIVRDGTAIFPHGDDQLEPGDRAIIFTESSRVAEVEKALRWSGRVRIPVARALGVDVGGRLNLVAALLKYFAAAFLLPTLIALGSDEPVWPFLAAAAVTGGDRLRRRAGHAGRSSTSGFARASSSSRSPG